MTKIKLYLLIIFLLSCEASIMGINAEEKRQVFVSASKLPSKIYEGERIIYDICLYSDNPKIISVSLVNPMSFSGLPVRQSAVDFKIKETRIGQKHYYSTVIDRYFIAAPSKGTYLISGGKYRITLGHTLRARTLFDGDVLIDRNEDHDSEVNPVSLRVVALPQKNKPLDFSGAVGKFNINVVSPIQSVFKGMNSKLKVTITGNGDLTTSVIPDIRTSFPKELGFKSISDSRSSFVKDGILGSEIEMEVEFCPKQSGEFRIGAIEFSFFNPSNGKYQKIASTPLVLKVENPKSESEKSQTFTI